MRYFGNLRGLQPNDEDSRYLDQFFNRNARRYYGKPIDDEGFTVPSINIRDTNGKGYVIEMAAPGFDKSDFDIKVQNGVLHIEAEHHETETDDTYTRREHNYSRFSRSFTLPETVKEDKIDATYQNGMLEIDVPVRAKAEEKDTIKNITIN